MGENAKKKNSCEEEGKEKNFMQKEGPIVTFSESLSFFQKAEKRRTADSFVVNKPSVSPETE